MIDGQRRYTIALRLPDRYRFDFASMRETPLHAPRRSDGDAGSGRGRRCDEDIQSIARQRVPANLHNQLRLLLEKRIQLHFPVVRELFFEGSSVLIFNDTILESEFDR